MNQSGGNKVTARVFLCMTGGALLLMGGVFEWLMIRSYRNARGSREWPKVEAVVLRSVIDERRFGESAPEFRANILYGYSFENENLTSSHFSPRGAKWMKNAEAVQKLADEYPVGSIHTAWVNPALPDYAIIKHDSMAAGYTLWFPALIMVGGMGMIVGAFRCSPLNK